MYIKTACEAFLCHIVEYKWLSINTRQCYYHCLDKFTKYCNFNWVMVVEQIKKETVREFVRYLKELKKPLNSKSYNWVNTGLEGKTIMLHIHAVRSFLKWCKFEDINCLDYKSIEAIKTESKILPSITWKDCKRLFEAPFVYEKDEFIALRNAIYIYMAYETGARIWELLSIRISDIGKDRFIIIRWKGNKYRKIKITQKTFEMIETYTIGRDDNDDRLFVSHSNNLLGNRLTAVAVQAFVRSYRQKLNFAVKVTPHTLRHTFATHLLQQGKDISVISRLLWHSSIVTTMKYLDIGENMINDAFDHHHRLLSQKRRYI